MMDVDEEKIPLDAADKMINLEKENFDLKKKVEVAEEVAAEFKKEKKKLNITYMSFGRLERRTRGS